MTKLVLDMEQVVNPLATTITTYLSALSTIQRQTECGKKNIKKNKR